MPDPHVRNGHRNISEWERWATRDSFMKVVDAGANRHAETDSRKPPHVARTPRPNVNQPLHCFRGIPYMNKFRTVKRHPDHTSVRLMSHVFGLRATDGRRDSGVGDRRIYRRPPRSVRPRFNASKKVIIPLQAMFQHWFESRQPSNKLEFYSSMKTRRAGLVFEWRKRSGGDDS